MLVEPRLLASPLLAQVDNGVVKDVQFAGGCMGNQAGIRALTRGMKIADVIERLKGIDCGGKGTSCPDQLATALEEALEEF